MRQQAVSKRGRVLGVLVGASAAFGAFEGCVSSDGSTPNVAGSDAGGLDASKGADANHPSDATADDATQDVNAPLDAKGDGNVVDAGADAADAMPVVPLDSGTYAAGGAWGPALEAGAPNYSAGVWGGQTLTFDSSGGLTSIANVSWSLSTSSALPEFGADGIAAWGRWSTGASTIPGGVPTMEAFNYIAGAQAPSPSVLKASYSAFASTAPTAVSGSTLVGTSNQVTGTVSYSAGTVSYSLANITVGGQTFAVSGSAGLYAGTGLLSDGTVTSTTNGCDAGCTGNLTNAPTVQGWFFGTNGERMGLNYGFTTPIGTVSGAVVLK